MKSLKDFISESKIIEKDFAAPRKIYQYFEVPYRGSSENNFCVNVRYKILTILVNHKIVKNWGSKLDDVTNIDLEVYDKKKLIATLKLSEDMECFKKLYKIIVDDNIYKELFDCEIKYNEDTNKNLVGNIKFELIRDKSKLKDAKEYDKFSRSVRDEQIAATYKSGKYNGD